MRSRRTDVLKGLLIVPALGIGLAALMALQSCRKDPQGRTVSERPVAVRVLELAPVDVVPRAVTQGTVRPARTWRAVAQVGGGVTQIHDRLRVGHSLAKDEVLVTIDKTEYEIERARTAAQIQTIEAQQTQLTVQGKADRASLAIEEASLALARQELDRLAALARTHKISTSEKEKQERAVLDQERQVQMTRNTIALLPAQGAVLATQLAAERQRLARAVLDIDRCTIRAPFRCRIASVSIEMAQVATPGQTLCTLDGMALAEVPAQFAIARMRPLVRPGRRPDLTKMPGTKRLGEVLGIAAEVTLSAGPDVFHWPARIARAESVAPQTRTVAIVVEVPDPFGESEQERRPPLFKGSSVRVVLSGSPHLARFVVPRTALIGESAVYVVDAEQRLRVREVKVEFVQGIFACIGEGLADGDRVVVSDLITARPGLLLRPTPDSGLATTLAEAATGRGDVR